MTPEESWRPLLAARVGSGPDHLHVPPAGRDEPVNIRTAQIDGEPWFVAADVCRCLGMDLGDGTTKWIATLTSNQKRRLSRREQPQIFCGTPLHLNKLRTDERRRAGRRDIPKLSLGTSAPTLTLISEPGLYKPTIIAATRTTPHSSTLTTGA